MAIRHTIYDIDLSKQLQRVFSGVLLAGNDKLANRMGANVYQDGKAVSLAGYTVKGYFIRNGVDTLILDGAVNGNAATVDLPSNCYYKDGSYTLTVKLCKGNTEQTLVIFDGRIAKTTTDTIVENENTISVADLVQQEWVQNVMDAADAIMGAGGNAAPAITCNAAGEIIAVQDAASRAPRVLNLYGITTQAAVPTPDAPAVMTSAGAVQMLVAGKNIFKPFTDSGVLNGITITPADDGSITLNGTATKGFFIAQTPDVPIPAGTYTLSANRNVEATFSLYCRTGNGTALGSTNTRATFTTKNTIASFRLWIDNGATFTNLVIRPQLEVGSAATEYEPYINVGAVTHSDSLPGIPVTAGGNHVDASGQHWAADYIDIPGKAMNNVLGSFVLDGSEGYEWTIATSSGLTVAYVGPQDKWSAHDATLVNDTRLMSTHFVGGMMTEVGRIKLDSNFINMTVPSGITTSAEMNAWLAANPVTVLYVRESPIITKLALDDIILPSPNATAYNDGGCSMHLTYDADTKTYIDNKFAAMTAALLSTGANV